MAHLVENMAYVAAHGAPWHKLGVPVTNDLTPLEMTAAAGLDWTVEKAPIYVTGFEGDAFDVINDRFALRRSSDGKVLDVVGPLYQPVQNDEALGFFTEFVSAGGMKMETAGSLDGGRRIWGLAAIQDGFTLAGGDRVNGYLMLCQPHRQGEAFTIKFTGVRVVCNNTLTMALNGHGASFRMSHANRFDGDMQQQAKVALGLAQSRLQEFQEKAELLAATRVQSEQHLVEYVATLSGSKLLDAAIDESTPQADGLSALDAVLNASEASAMVRGIRATDLNRAGKMILESILDSPGSELPSAQGTYWGAVNGVTYAVDHQMGRTDDSRLTSAWFGPRSALKTQAVELALNYATRS